MRLLARKRLPGHFCAMTTGLLTPQNCISVAALAVSAGSAMLARRAAMRDRAIADAASVRVAGIQGQADFMRALQAEVLELRRRVDALERELELERTLRQQAEARQRDCEERHRSLVERIRKRGGSAA